MANSEDKRKYYLVQKIRNGFGVVVDTALRIINPELGHAGNPKLSVYMAELSQKFKFSIQYI